MICRICKKEFKDVTSLSKHISKSHKDIEPKQYYREYIGDANDGYCKECGKETSFRSMSKGFLKYCSTKCSNSTLQKRKIVSNSSRERLSGKVYTKEEKKKIWGSIDYKKTEMKRKKTMTERYGVDNYSKTESFRTMKRNNYKEGEIHCNNQGCEFIISKYIDYQNVRIRFLDKYGFEKYTRYGDIINGSVSNPYYKSVFGTGFLGHGIHKSRIDGKITKKYKMWNHMLERCYSSEFSKNNTAYKDVIVCDEWHNFQNFGNWFDKNYYEVENETMSIDKDILVKRNKIYSPKTCLIVPLHINAIFIKNKRIRGNCPIGVCNNNEKYTVKVREHKIGKRKQLVLGSFYNKQYAYEIYKEKKESIIKSVAEEYKDKIPKKVYVALLEYVVDIDD